MWLEVKVMTEQIKKILKLKMSSAFGILRRTSSWRQGL